MLKTIVPQFRVNTSKFHPSQTSTLKDKLILVDEKDNYVQPLQKVTAHRWEYIDSGKPHRAFSVFLFNQNHRLLMQRRSKVKILFPLLWTNSCCSHPIVLNQSPLQLQSQQQAIRKRVPFELGMNIDSQKLHFVGKLVYKAQGDNKQWGQYEVDSIYFSKVDGQPDPNKDEVDDVEWVGLEEMDEFIQRKGGKVTPWFRKIYEGDLKKWWKQYTKN